MRFFGSKSNKKIQLHSPTSISSGEASSASTTENRTDVIHKKDTGQTKLDGGTREKSSINPINVSALLNTAAEQHKKEQHQQQLSPNKRRGVKSLVKPPAKKGENNRIDGSSGRTSGQQPNTITTSHHRKISSSSSKHSTTKQQIEKKTTVVSSPKEESEKVNLPPPKQQPPVSILHKAKHTPSPNSNVATTDSGTKFTFASSPPPPPPTDTNSPYYHNRVRFMSAGSVASTEASQVHLMGLGGAGSVASSSAMSSSIGRENVFDRVLNMVMKEENDRLSAMGMSRMDPPMSDAVSNSNTNIIGGGSSMAKKKPDPPISISDAPIDHTDMVHHRSPIDVDTGLEIEYHDLNDDDEIIDAARWKRLNDATKLSSKLAKGMKGLSVDKDRRVSSQKYGTKKTASSQGYVDDEAEF